MSKLEDFLKAYHLLGKHGDYDTSIAGAIGEAYAEEALGMEKAEAGTKGIDEDTTCVSFLGISRERLFAVSALSI